MGVVSVSMPEELLSEIDRLVDEHDYSGRSEVVRAAGRKLVEEFDERQLEGKRLVGLVSVLYPYDNSDIETGLTDLRHSHSEQIRTNSHSCVGNNEGCIETFVLEGSLDDISSFVRDVEAVSERLHVDYSLYPLDAIEKQDLFLQTQ